MTGVAIETERLRLRPVEAADAESLHALLTHPDVRRFLFDDVEISRDEATDIVDRNRRLFDERGCGLWIVERRDGGSVDGVAGFCRFHDQLELLYALAPASWGRGIATEAAQALVRFGFEELGFERVVASTDAANGASVAVMRRAGLAFERRDVVDGLDTIFYAVGRDAFRADGAAYRVMGSRE